MTESEQPGWKRRQAKITQVEEPCLLLGFQRYSLFGDTVAVD